MLLSQTQTAIRGAQCPLFRHVRPSEYEKLHFSQFYILKNLRTASPKKLVSQDFDSQNLWTLKKYFNMIWHFFLEQGTPVSWWNSCPFCPLPPAPKGFERRAVTALHTAGASWMSCFNWVTVLTTPVHLAWASRSQCYNQIAPMQQFTEAPATVNRAIHMILATLFNSQVISSDPGLLPLHQFIPESQRDRCLIHRLCDQRCIPQLASWLYWLPSKECMKISCPQNPAAPKNPKWKSSTPCFLPWMWAGRFSTEISKYEWSS